MRRIAAFLLALIMGLGFTLVLAPDANAKTAFIAYGSKSMAPNGAFSDWEFTGEPAIGGGIRFGMDGRFSFGLDYMGQRMNGISGLRFIVHTGQSAIENARFHGYDISQYNVTPEMVLASTEKAESGLFSIATGTFYVSLVPENGSRLIVEPVIGFIGGVSIAQHRTDWSYYYHPQHDEMMGYTEEILRELYGRDTDHWHFSNDDGSGHGRENAYSYKPLAGLAFGLNFFPVENLIIAPEIRYLYNFGFTVRTGIGVAF